MTRTRSVIISVCALLLLSCSAELIRDPSVERWCGDLPCEWQVEGDVKRVGTWHPNDYAVSLVSDDATLIQENAIVDNQDTDCFHFAMVAKIDSGVKVFLELDFLADGSVEFSQQMPVSNWERRTFRVSAPEWYSKVRFIIRKDGPGRAILAEISAKTARGQCTAPRIELLDRPEGAACTSEDQCADGRACVSGRCGGCASDDSCDDDQVCALQDVNDTRYTVCVERASAPFGAACDRDEQCETGVCGGGACSECKDDEDCEDDRVCDLSSARPGNSRFWPKLCGGGRFARESGESCTGNTDCRSSQCEDVVTRCDPNLNCQGGETPCLSCGPELQLGTCR